MSTIFELFGYPVDSWDERAWENLRRRHCPFMDAECDGGGNRFSSAISLARNSELRPFFDGADRVQAGVCSLRMHDGEQPWIVCPRRLLNFRGSRMDGQKYLKESLFRYAGLEPGKRYSVWSEIKMKCNVSNGAKNCLFDYTFDYVIAGCRPTRLSSVAALLGRTVPATRRIIESNGMTTCFRDGEYWYEDFPGKPLIIVEVMTSSTSGGNEQKGTRIGQVFEDTILRLAGRPLSPDGPGINYRQVWARMVSQLLVKSQIGRAWGGTTFWVVQDLLADYISKTTALDLDGFLSDAVSEVNILSSGYDDAIVKEKRHGDLIDLPGVKLFSGPVSADVGGRKAFVDIVKAGCTPGIDELLRRLVEKKPCAAFSL